jgi:hypothetical protein
MLNVFSQSVTLMTVCLYFRIKLQGEDAEIIGPDFSDLASTSYASILHVSVTDMESELTKSGEKKSCLFAKK